MIKNVGERIRTIREQKNLTQANMAEELGMKDGSAYSKIERGEVNPPLKRLFQIAEVLEVEIGVFFENKPSQVKEAKTNYGNATKAELSEVVDSIKQLSKKIDELKEIIPKGKTATPKSNKGKKQ
jgi:transcriptional regulator with XRE-family HTH domain